MPDDANSAVTPNPSENNSNREALPEWARAEISKANNEAATKRVELRTKTEEHSTALQQITTLTDEKTALASLKEGLELELLKVNIALDAGVPGDRVRSIAARLVGSNEAELKADAANLVNEFGLTNVPRTPATDPNQGRTGDDGTPVSNNPASIFAGYIKDQFENM